MCVSCLRKYTGTQGMQGWQELQDPGLWLSQLLAVCQKSEPSPISTEGAVARPEDVHLMLPGPSPEHPELAVQGTRGLGNQEGGGRAVPLGLEGL